MDKVFYPITLKINPSNTLYIFLFDMNFENLTDRLYIFYILNMYIKFSSNRMLFSIWSINLFFSINLDHKIFKFKHLIDDIAIDLWLFWNFTSIEDIIKTCNIMVKFSKFTSNKKIYRVFEGFIFKVIG